MRSDTKKKRARDYAASRGWTVIGEAEWQELHTSLPDISDSTLRTAGLRIAQPWLGVVQHSLAELESSLNELTLVYHQRPDLQRYCRDQVIAAKDCARWLSRNARLDPEKRQAKAGMVDWMLVWLDDPSMFEIWAIGAKRAKSNAMPENATGQCTVCKGTGNGDLSSK